MQVIVHGGMQKTGSSAIQDYLASNRAELRDIGISYPDFGHRGHWLLSAAFTKNPGNYHHAERRLAGADVQAEVDAALGKLKDIISSAGASDVVLLSHEDLSVAYKAQKLREFVSEITGAGGDFTMLAYVRNPVAHYPSAVQQSLKAGKDRAFSPTDWISPHLGRAPQLQAAINAVLTFRAHAPVALKDQDVIEDFRQYVRDRTGKTLPEKTTTEEVNASISARACAIIQASELLDAGEQVSKMLRRTVRQFDATQPSVKLVTPAAWNDHIAKANGPAWNALVATMAYNAEIARELQIADIDVTGRFSDADVCDWVLSYLDAGYTDGLLRFHRENNRGRPAAKLVDSLIERIGTEPLSSGLKDWRAPAPRRQPDRQRRGRASD